MRNSNRDCTSTIRSRGSTTPKASTVALTTRDIRLTKHAGCIAAQHQQTFLLSQPWLRIQSCEPDTYNKGLVSLAINDPWPCAKTAAVGECQDRLMLAEATGNPYDEWHFSLRPPQSIPQLSLTACPTIIDEVG